MVEGARLESAYTPKAYPGFESLSLRRAKERCRSGRSGLTRNQVYSHGYRGFESHPLRFKVRLLACDRTFLFAYICPAVALRRRRSARPTICAGVAIYESEHRYCFGSLALFNRTFPI